MCNYFDPSEQAGEKQDAKVDVKKSTNQLRQINGKFAFPDAIIDWADIYAKHK